MTTSPIEIAIGVEDAEVLRPVREVMARLGYRVRGEAATGPELRALCLRTRPDIIVASVSLPLLDPDSACHEAGAEGPTPIVLIASALDRHLLERWTNGLVFAFLIRPINPPELETAVTIAAQRARELRALRRELADLRLALENRKKIERAKGLIMRVSGLDEEQAFRRLQKMARDQNQKLWEVASMVLRTHQAFAPGEG